MFCFQVNWLYGARSIHRERKLTEIAGKSCMMRGIWRGNWPGLHIFSRNSSVLRLEIDIRHSAYVHVIISHRRRKLLTTTDS